MPRKKTVKKQTLLKHLLERRFLQIIFIYFGICWTILEFLSWLIENYQISPHLTDLGLITLLSMFPTVGMLAYFHGKPGRDEWTRVEKIGIPLNLLFTVILIFVVFSGKELGSATTQVTLQNEQGQIIRRKIPTSNFNRRLAIFFFRNQSGQTQLDWLQSAFMMGCHLDLVQDPVFSLYSASDNVIYQKILQAGLNSAIGLPMTLEKKIAGEIQREYFLGGSFTTSNDTFIVNTYLYETGTGKLIAERVYRNPNFYSIIDQITRQSKNDLGLPNWHIENTEDLPINALLTDNFEASREYFIGSELVNLKNNYRDATIHFEKATRLDPTFTMAHWMLYTCYINNNQPAPAQSALQAAMQHIYKIPELTRFTFKQEYYLITENPDKRFAVLEMWVKLYPRDIRGHFSLAAEYLKRNEPDKVITEYNTIMHLDPARLYYLQYIGDIYLRQGDFKNALKYYKQYQKKCPTDYSTFTAFGNLYFTMGNYEAARQYYTDAIAIEPNDIASIIQLGNIALESGAPESAFQSYQEALEHVRTAAEKNQAYEALQNYYEHTGQIHQAIRTRDAKFSAQAEYLNPASVALNRILDSSIKYHLYTGNPPAAIQYIKQIENRLAPPWNKLAAIAYLEYYIEQDQIAQATATVDKVEAAIEIFSSYDLSDRLHHARGQICELNEDYVGAVMEYQSELNLRPTNVTVIIDIARCYRQSGNAAKARSLLATTLKIKPHHPAANLEMARIYHALGESSQALHYLETALKIWNNADPDFAPAQNARKLAAQLSSAVS